MRYPFFFFILFFLCDIANPAFSQNQRPLRFEIGFQNDNDVYLMAFQDRYYTNGLEFYFKKAIDPTKFSEKLANKNWTLNIGQKIYNAHNGAVENITEVDRPLTGYLYVGGELNWFYKNEAVLSIGTELATIGPNAYGQVSQETFHNIFGFYTIAGWEYQLNNAVGIDVYTRYSHKLFQSSSKKWDGFLNTALSLGLNNNRVAIGPSFRYGRFNPMFESSAMGGRVSFNDSKPNNEFYFFYQPQLNWVLYNSTIQGGMLSRNKGPVIYSVMPMVLSQVAGVQWNSNRVGINLNYTFNTKEVKSTAVSHQYGSLRLAYYF